MKHALCEAAAQVRAACGQTQQDFANRVNWAISTIARYETSRPPKGRALSVYAALATANDRPDLYRIFREQLVREMGTELDSTADIFEAMTNIAIVVRDAQLSMDHMTRLDRAFKIVHQLSKNMAITKVELEEILPAAPEAGKIIGLVSDGLIEIAPAERA